MTHDEILKALFDETLIGNAPRVLELTQEGLDTGPVYGVMTELVRRDDTAGTLLGRVAEGLVEGTGAVTAAVFGVGTMAVPPAASMAVHTAA